MVGNLNSEVTSILVALDCTLEVIREAKEKNCNFIFTHHPLMFRKPSSITNETLLGCKIMELVKNDIAVYSSHTNLDALSGGICDILMDMLELKNTTVIEPSKYSGGIGRISELQQPRALGDVISSVKNSLKLNNLRYIGNEDMTVTKIAVVNGSGTDYLEMCKAQGANCIITGDVSYHYASDYKEENIAIIDAGHFGTEWLPFAEFSKKVEIEINSLGYKNSVIVSQKISDPYKTK